MTEAVKIISDPASGTQMKVTVPANCGGVQPPWADMMDPASYAVNVPGMMEAITQPLYSYQAYPAAGTANPLVFFQSQPIGAITQEDTNMQLAGQLPSPQRFLIQGIAIDYLPGTQPTRFGAQTALGQINDVYTILRRGLVTLTIGSKNYLQVSPMMTLPPRSHINGVAAASDQTTPAATMQTFSSVGYSDGDVFKPRPLLIEASQNFQVSIAFPGGLVAIPSADAAARIGVVMYGTLYRPVQ